MLVKRDFKYYNYFIFMDLSVAAEPCLACVCSSKYLATTTVVLKNRSIMAITILSYLIMVIGSLAKGLKVKRIEI